MLPIIAGGEIAANRDVPGGSATDSPSPEKANKGNRLRKFIIGGLAAFAMVAIPAALGTAPANADTTKCSTDSGPYGSTTTCNIFTDDGGWNITSTYCDNNGNCTTD